MSLRGQAAAASLETTQDASEGTSRRRIEKSSSAFRSIGEAAEELGLKTHVLRFWETKFSELKPMKRKDGRRFYRPEDMVVLRLLQTLLHEQGMTIKGVQRLFKQRKIADIAADANVQSMQTLQSPRASVAGQSVRDLQDAVQTAVQSGAFRSLADAEVQDNASSDRLNRLLGDLVDLKGRLDEVRKA